MTLNMISLTAVSTLEIDNVTSTTATLDWDNASPTNVYNIRYSTDGGTTSCTTISTITDVVNISRRSIIPI